MATRHVGTREQQRLKGLIQNATLCNISQPEQNNACQEKDLDKKANPAAQNSMATCNPRKKLSGVHKKWH